MARKAKFTVTLDMPPFANKEDVRVYIEDAVSTMKGSLFPGDEEEEPDPLWSLDEKSINVRIGR